VVVRLDVDGATVHFGAHRALEAVDLEVAPGEVVAILGPSGSGKSTLLRAVAGLQPLTAGTIRLDGRDLESVPPHRRGIGMMFQHHALFPHRDVAGNVGFGLRQRGDARTSVEADVERLLALVGLPGFGHRPVGELSGGEQQRVALARALAPAPAVLLLDEPMGALDRSLRERLAHDVRVLIDDLGLTVVAVTHDQAEAFAMANRIVVLAAGEVRQAGTPEEVWTDPADAVVAELLGLGATVAVEVRGGRASTPWGAVAVGGADGRATVLVRPAGVRLDADGAVEARVTATAFQGATTTVELAVGAAPSLRAEVASARAPARGAVVRVALDPRGCSRLPG
jgi:thiamine transport system ATP-binding protein